MTNLKHRNIGAKLIPHLCALLVLIAVSFIFMWPALKGKTIAHGDVLQAKGMRWDVKYLHETTGEISRWTNRNFAGMPTNQLYTVHPSNVPRTILMELNKGIGKEPFQLLLYFLCFYIAGIALGFPWYFAGIGALAFGLSTNNILLIDVGHTGKALTLACAPPMFAGVWLLLKKRWVSGFLLLTIFTAFQIGGNHFQITYYSFLLIGVMMIADAIRKLKGRNWKTPLKSSSIIAAAVVIAALPNVSLLWTTYDYTSETVRGKRILENTNETGGLNSDYANVFSQGIFETMTFLIPRFKGGSNSEWLGKNSATFKTISRNGIQGSRIDGEKIVVPLYWGDQPISAGPIYWGASVILLFICSLFWVSGPKRWMFLSIIATCLLIAWGRHTGFINDLFFNYIPFYNKFRAPSMILSLANMVAIWMILEGLMVLKNKPKVVLSKLKNTRRAVIGVAFLCLLLAAAGPLLYDFQWSFGKEQYGFGLDENFENQLLQAGNPPREVGQVMQSIRSDRATWLRLDAVRSLIFILIGSALIWAYFKKWLSPRLILFCGTILIFSDLWLIDKRYLNRSDFRPDLSNLHFPSSHSDIAIKERKSPHDRTLDLTTSIFQDARPCFHHASIGGNHGAKLRRYQDLIDHHLKKEIAPIQSGAKSGGVPALNMLNTRFIKTGTAENDYLHNVTALGHAWFANQIKWVDSANEELAAIDSLQGSEIAIVHEAFRKYMEGFEPQELEYGKIELLKYLPGDITYRTTTSVEQFAVFSEIWYKGNQHWKVTVDGKKSAHIRANYLLRGMRVPAGKHTIRFQYKPRPYLLGEKISKFGSVLFFLVLAGTSFFGWRRRNQNSN
jgi:hypothetical protein